MPTPATATDFFDLLKRSRLLPADVIEAYSTTSDENGAEPRTSDNVARQLIREQLLTPFQARQLLQGRHRGFFLTDKFKVLDLVGEGGMGRVLLCEHLILHKLVAVKILHHGGDAVPGAVERFLREARAAATLDHPNIVRVLDVDRGPTGPFMVMDYVDGTNLHQLVAQHGPLTVERAANYIRQAALGLQHAHEKGLIHRDIKPGNLILDRTGTVELLDLGLARFFDVAKNQNLTRRFDAQNVLGTADFIAPEQTLNSSKVDIRADIYSLGCTFYYLLLRKFPFEEGSATQKLLWHQSRDPVPVRELRPDVPAGLAAILDKMMKKDPNERYQTPAELAADLDAWCVKPVPLPSASEMPRVLPSTFRMGLCPPPSGAVASANTPSSMTADVPTSIGSGRRTAPHPQPATTDDPATAIKTERYRSPRSNRLLIVLSAVAIVAVFVALASVAYQFFGKPGERLTGTNPDSPPSNSLKIGGSTFIKPVMERWAEEYEKKTGIHIDYQPLGSSRGIMEMTNKSFDFACTEAPLSEEQERMAKSIGGDFMYVPLVLGAVVPIYNLPEIEEPLNFNGSILVNIYLGRITKWKDQAIAASNPKVAAKLPDLPIQVIRRKDGAGTTYVFTDYLSKVSKEWEQQSGKPGSLPKWPTNAQKQVFGEEVEGSHGMAQKVSGTPGAIGYVEWTQAVKHRNQIGKLENKSGNSIAPSSESVAAAYGSLTAVPANLQFSLTDLPGANSYPLAGTCWAVIYTNQIPSNPTLRGFLNWVLTEGQKYASELNYSQLPPSLVPRARKLLELPAKK